MICRRRDSNHYDICIEASRAGLVKTLERLVPIMNPNREGMMAQNIQLM